ncbi:hypothetical protein MNAN1_003355 [Malassezia nana]|uniref:Uncharacterized protein n=1 Tax=Malassezia nana TaxID=180528 RepID=A0AAF0EPE7_9BASI|nr:hypothetical protein MNAN1_003355 [Malassezia nana]
MSGMYVEEEVPVPPASSELAHSAPRMSELGVPTAKDYLRHALNSLHGAQIVQTLPEVRDAVSRQNDLVQAMLRRYAPDQDRLYSEAQAPLDSSIEPADAIVDAIDAHHWRQAAVIAGECVCHLPPQETPITEDDLQHTLAWWHVRLVSLGKLQLYSQLRAELHALWTVLESLRIWDEDAQDVVPLARAAMVPFSLHVMHAQHLFLGGFQSEGTQCLCSLSTHAASMAKSDGNERDVWHRRYVRVRVLLASLLIEADQLPTAATVLSDLESALKESGLVDPAVLLMLTRLYLALGDVQSARCTLQQVKQEESASSSSLAASIATHEALLHYTVRPHEPFDFAEEMKTYEAGACDLSLTNTMALDALLRGDIVPGIQLIERLLQEHPAAVATAMKERERVVRYLVQWAGDESAWASESM